MILSLITLTALAQAPVIRLESGDIPDPYRWLEDIEDPTTIAWWSARDAEARAWTWQTGLEPALAQYSLDWLVERPAQELLLDEAQGLLLVQRQRYLPPQDKPPESGQRLRSSSQLLLRSSAGERELGPASMQVTDPICAARLDPTAQRVVWGRLDQDPKAPTCHLFITELHNGETWPLLEGRVSSVVFSPDGQRLLLAVAEDQQAQVLELSLDGSVQTQLLRSRRRLSAGWLPDGQIIVLSDARLRPTHGPFTSAPRTWVALGSAEELRWLKRGPRGLPRGTYSFVGVQDGKLLLLTDVNAADKRIVRLDPKHPSPRTWEELLPPQPEAPLKQARLFEDTVLLDRARDGQRHLEALPLSAAPGQAPTPLGVSATSHMVLRVREGRTLVTTFSVDGQRNYLISPDLTLTPAGESLTHAVSVATEYARSADGTEIPLTVMRPAQTAPGGPVWLEVYGGFSVSQTAALGPTQDLWLSLGGTYVTVHARGGDERGEDWHEAAMTTEKPRTIEDLIAAAEHFVAEGTAPQHIVISGASNGGLTVAAAAAQRPDLFGAVLARSGVYDLLRGPWMGAWWPDEYGSVLGPPEEQETLRALSPVHRIPAGSLPPMLLSTGYRDLTVSPAHSYKLAAAWGELPGGPVLLRVDPWTTHEVQTGDRERPYRAWASDMAFVLRALDLDWPPQTGDESGAE